jgi:hypothetical protein
MKATDAASTFDGIGTGVVTAKKQFFYRRRIFATFAGVLLLKRDTIPPASNALFRRPQFRSDRTGVRRSKIWPPRAGTDYQTRENS